ncbi:MAG: hypothetical protein ACKPJD_27390 [Planctomycetaceae bacterium]
MILEAGFEAGFTVVLGFAGVLAGNAAVAGTGLGAWTTGLGASSGRLTAGFAAVTGVA